MRLPETIDTPLRTAVCILVLPPGLIIASLLGMVLGLLGAPQRRVNIAYTGFARFCLLMGATRLEVNGLDWLKRDQGAFATAIGFGLPVLPVAIAGTRPIWPKGKLRLRRGTVAIEVGEPIPIEGLTIDDRTSLRDRTHAVVAELRARARQRLRDWGHDPGGID